MEDVGDVNAARQGLTDTGYDVFEQDQTYIGYVRAGHGICTRKRLVLSFVWLMSLVIGISLYTSVTRASHSVPSTGPSEQSMATLSSHLSSSYASSSSSISPPPTPSSSQPPLFAFTPPRPAPAPLLPFPASSSTAFACGSDRTTIGNRAPRIISSNLTWNQSKSETVRIKLWGGGGVGGRAVKLVPTNGECSQARRLRGGRGGGRGGGGGGSGRDGGGRRSYTGSGTKADLDNHANQMNPNNWRYWSSRGQQPPWAAAGYQSRSQSSGRDMPGAMYVPYRNQRHRQGPYTGTGTKSDLDNHANQLNPNNWRFWRSRGLPMAVAKRYARQAAAAAGKWVPRGRRWRLSMHRRSTSSLGRRHDGRRLDRQSNDCGEVWLCGGGGGAGAFTESVVYLQAGHEYLLQVGRGGSADSPNGMPTTLSEVTPTGPVVLVQAFGGFGAGATDEQRLVSLGGVGGPATPIMSGVEQSFPGGDGAPSRTDFRDLSSAGSLLAGANFSAVQEMSAEDVALSLSAIRIPCAEGARAGSVEAELLRTECLAHQCQVNTRFGSQTARCSVHEQSICSKTDRSPQHLREDPVSDHMLVCQKYAYGAGSLRVGDKVRITDECGFWWELGPYNLPAPTGTTGIIVEISNGNTNEVEVFVKTALQNEPLSFKSEHLGCIREVRPFNGTNCFGVACLRSRPGGECHALPSCLDGLAAWVDRFSLGNQHNQAWNQGAFGSFQTLHARLSSSGPKGGVSLEGSPSGNPAGHGGDGSCPEISPDQEYPQLRTVMLSGFSARGPNGLYIERKQAAYEVQGQSSFWSNSGHFLYWCKPSSRWTLAFQDSFKRNKDGHCDGISNAPSDLDIHTTNFLGWIEWQNDDCHTFNFGPGDCNSNMDWTDCKKFLCCHNWGLGCVKGNRNPSFPVISNTNSEAGVYTVGTTPSPGAFDLADALPQAAEPKSGEPGLAVFYSCAELGVSEPTADSQRVV